ncbi:MAG: hypothetical protein OXF02_07760 [Simkaniaceae bacterium]|nr:hypothetical protein [Simkaniaceae bacterium]
MTHPVDGSRSPTLVPEPPCVRHESVTDARCSATYDALKTELAGMAGKFDDAEACSLQLAKYVDKVVKERAFSLTEMDALVMKAFLRASGNRKTTDRMRSANSQVWQMLDVFVRAKAHLEIMDAYALCAFVENLDALEYLEVEGHAESRGDDPGISIILPPKMTNLRHLSCLILRYTRLRTLPSDLGNLGQLHTLDVSDNQLTALPTTIGKLTCLQILDVGRNGLCKLPSTMEDLLQLYCLRADNNHLDALFPGITKLMQLNYLFLGDNELTELPDGMWDVALLLQLDLRSNRLTNLPPGINKLSMLQVLLIGNNQLGALLPDMGGLPELVSLDVSNNGLQNLPDELCNLHKLEVLDASENDLQNVPWQIGNLTNLKAVYLQNNNLYALPPGMESASGPTRLNINGNPLLTLRLECNIPEVESSVDCHGAHRCSFPKRKRDDAPC